MNRFSVGDEAVPVIDKWYKGVPCSIIKVIDNEDVYHVGFPSGKVIILSGHELKTREPHQEPPAHNHVNGMR